MIRPREERRREIIKYQKTSFVVMLLQHKIPQRGRNIHWMHILKESHLFAGYVERKLMISELHNRKFES
jgi:hypothetical protein